MINILLLIKYILSKVKKPQPYRITWNEQERDYLILKIRYYLTCARTYDEKFKSYHLDLADEFKNALKGEFTEKPQEFLKAKEHLNENKNALIRAYIEKHKED